MPFQVIKDEYYNNLIRDLFEKVPEFQSVFDEEDGVYPILGEFGRFVIDNINNQSIAKKSFEFINHAISQGGKETEDAVVLQIFQPIYDNDLLVSKTKPYLSVKGLEIFLKFKDKYDNDSLE